MQRKIGPETRALLGEEKRARLEGKAPPPPPEPRAETPPLSREERAALHERKMVVGSRLCDAVDLTIEDTDWTLHPPGAPPSRSMSRPIICVRGDMSIQARLWADVANDRTVWSLGAKPAAIDALLWEILGKPPGATGWDYMVCEWIPLVSQEQPGLPEEWGLHARDFVAWATREAEAAPQESWSDFATRIENDDLQRSKGKYEPELICALIADGRLEEARSEALDFHRGGRDSSRHIVGFYRRVINWLFRQRPSPEGD